MSYHKDIRILADPIEEKYKVTAFEAALAGKRDTTLKEYGIFVQRHMQDKHPEIAWGCFAIKRTGDTQMNNFVVKPSGAAQFLSFIVAETFHIRLFAVL